MAEYIAINTDAKVIGRAIMGVARALGDKALPLLKARGLDNVQPDGWYRQQDWLDVLREVDKGDMFDLIAVGKHVSASVPLPAEVDSVESVLMLMGATYTHNHQNCPGYAVTESIGERALKITVCDPYPHNMVYGVIYGFAARFEPHAVVRYENNQICPTESECCVYFVTW